MFEYQLDATEGEARTGRLTLPASCAAGAKRSLEIARIWAAERKQWGAPIGKHDAVAQKLGRMAADTFAMESLSDLASLMADRHTVDIRLEAAMAKMWNSEVGWRIVDDLLQIKGGRGYETADSLRRRRRRAPLPSRQAASPLVQARAETPGTPSSERPSLSTIAVPRVTVYVSDGSNGA